MPLVTINLNAGRDDATIDAMLDAEAAGVTPDPVMIVLVKTVWENSAFGGGTLLHAS